MTQKQEVHFSGKVAQKAIIENDNGEVMILRDARELEEVWEIPGGRMNEGESPEEALAREIKEELGVDVEVRGVIHLEQFLQGADQANALMIAYSCTLIDPVAKFVLEEKEVAEVRWVSREDCKKLKFFPEYENALEKYFSAKI